MKLKSFYMLPLTLVVYGEAAACAPGSVAYDYLKAIDAMNWSAMRGHLAEDAVYTDPTMTHFDSPSINLHGADNIVAFWRSSSAESGTSKISYIITTCLETAGYHAVDLDINVRVSGHFWGVAKDEIDLSGQFVSIIRAQDGFVTEHHDYVDYSSVDEQIATLKKKYGET